MQAAVAAGKLQELELGSSECKELFCLDPDFTYLNHGSYGAAYRWVPQCRCSINWLNMLDRRQMLSSATAGGR
jgi:hypothetical protein